MSTRREKNLEALLSLTVFLVVLYALLHFKALLAAAIIVGLGGLAVKPLCDKIAWAWLKLSMSIGFVISRLLLSLIFFVVLTPIGLLWRIANRKDQLQLKRKAGSTYYTDRDHEYLPEDLENTW